MSERILAQLRALHASKSGARVTQNPEPIYRNDFAPFLFSDKNNESVQVGLSWFPKFMITPVGEEDKLRPFRLTSTTDPTGNVNVEQTSLEEWKVLAEAWIKKVKDLKVEDLRSNILSFQIKKDAAGILAQRLDTMSKTHYVCVVWSQGDKWQLADETIDYQTLHVYSALRLLLLADNPDWSLLTQHFPPPLQTFSSSVFQTDTRYSLIPMLHREIQALAPNVFMRENETEVSFDDYREFSEFTDGQIEALRNVETLDLSHTNIKNLPEDFKKLARLRKLDLSYTLITAIPAVLKDMDALKTLNISGLNLNKNAVSNLATLAKNSKLLKKLIVMDVNFSDPKAWLGILKLKADNPSLKIRIDLDTIGEWKETFRKLLESFVEKEPDDADSGNADSVDPANEKEVYIYTEDSEDSEIIEDDDDLELVGEEEVIIPEYADMDTNNRFAARRAHSARAAIRRPR